MLRILSFTKTGIELNEKLCKKLNNDSCAGYAPKRILDRKEELTYLPENIPEWIQEYWGVDDFLFIGAAGIAVRMMQSESVLLQGQYRLPILLPDVLPEFSYSFP